MMLLADCFALASSRVAFLNSEHDLKADWRAVAGFKHKLKENLSVGVERQRCSEQRFIESSGNRCSI
jgi:hypothetical protein